MRKLTVLFTLVILVTPLIATAQEDDIAQYASLDQLGNVINALVAGDEVEGIIFDAAEEASDVIVRQFQITTNLVSGPTRGKADIEFVPVGFSEGSTTELDNLEEQFDGTIGEFDGIIPPLAPDSRVGDEIDVSAIFEGWTAYGDRGPIDGPIIINPAVQTIWGVELTDSIDGTCPETRYVGRTWISQGVGGAPDPLFTSEALMDSYGGSHQAITGSGGRLIQFQCTFQGSVAWAQRMKDDGTVRSFGPTGVIALVKDRFVVFFIWVNELDGRLDQVFYASPADGGPVVVSEVESDDLLLVPNPYEAYPTRISIVVDGTENANNDNGARQLLYDGETASGLKIQTGGGCTLRDTELFTRDDFLEAATSNGFARDSNQTAIYKTTPGAFEYRLIGSNGYEESGQVDISTGDMAFETSSGCTGTGKVSINGEPLGDGGTTDTPADETPETEDGSTAGAGGESDTTPAEEGGGIPWGAIWAAIALAVAAAVYTVSRNRTKKDCKPEEEALDAAIRASSLASEAATEKETAVQEAIKSDASPEATARARAEAAEAHAAAEVAMEAYRQARAAYQACKGAADTGDEIGPVGAGVGTTRTRPDTPEPEPEDGGTPIPPAGPDVLSDPPEDPADPDERCREGNEKVIPDPSMPPKTFTVPIGNIVVLGYDMKSWNRVFGGKSGLTADAFGDLTEDDLENALSNFDNQSKVVRIHPVIPIAVYTVECGYVHRCTNGEWVQTDEIGQYKTTRTVPKALNFGNKKDSPNKENAIKHVQDAQTKLEELQEEQADYDNFECG